MHVRCLHSMKAMLVSKFPPPETWSLGCVTHALRVRSNDPCPHARPAGQFSAPALKATAPTHMKWAGAVAGWTGLLSFHESYAG